MTSKDSTARVIHLLMFMGETPFIPVASLYGLCVHSFLSKSNRITWLLARRSLGLHMPTEVCLL